MGALDRVAYRSRQMWQALMARPLSIEARDEVDGILNPQEARLFNRQDVAGQQHGYRVMQTLKSTGNEEVDLLAAALLHDVGKSRFRSSWWDRPVVVIGQALFPDRSYHWAQGELNGWNRPFIIKARHPDWGAEAAATIGSSPMTVNLIRRHQVCINGPGENREDRLLLLLQEADNKN